MLLLVELLLSWLKQLVPVVVKGGAIVGVSILC
jgi:hypothetical protein